MGSDHDRLIVDKDGLILVTGATGFIGSKLVEALLDRGFRNIRCFARSSGKAGKVRALGSRYQDGAQIEVVTGNLLCPEDCAAATKDVALIFHLAAARGEKSIPDAFMNSVVTTRNLLEASLAHQCLRRFVNVSSLAVYTNAEKPQGKLLDEACPVEIRPALRGDAYCFAKVKQEEIVRDYGKRFGTPYVIVRPGHVYGPGNEGMTGRVGINTFGVFLHLGGSNTIPLTYVDNCADAIALTGIRKLATDSEVFNVIDDDLPSSRKLLREYKENVRPFRSIYVPHFLSYLLCYLWERYSTWSEGQLEPVFNRKRWRANWKKTAYSNGKLKAVVGWTPRVSTTDGLRAYFAACRNTRADA